VLIKGFVISSSDAKYQEFVVSYNFVSLNLDLNTLMMYTNEDQSILPVPNRYFEAPDTSNWRKSRLINVGQKMVCSGVTPRDCYFAGSFYDSAALIEKPAIFRRDLCSGGYSAGT